MAIKLLNLWIIDRISNGYNIVVRIKEESLMLRFGRERVGFAEISCGIYCNRLMKVIVIHEPFNLLPFVGTYYHKEVDINIRRGFETVDHLFPILEFHPAVGASGGIDISDNLEIGGIEIAIHGDVTYLKSKSLRNYDFLANPFRDNILLLLV